MFVGRCETGLRRQAVAVVSILGIMAAVLIGGNPATAAAKNTIPGSGTYLVGRDFNAGVYRSTGNISCYWERATNASGSLSSIIANDIGGGQRLVYVRSTDRVFKTSRCHTWNRVFSTVLKTKSKRTTIPGSGSYLVGSDFMPGTYRSTGNSGSCYWERARSADGTLGSIIANGISKGQLVVTISASDSIFQTNRCAIWRRIA
jgi:hypothetical protein